MPGMTPQKKAAKGIFGAAGIGPSLQWIPPTPPSGIQVPNGATVDVAVLALDAEDGDVSASATYVSDLDGSLGSGATATLSFTSVGTHVITCTVTAPTGGQTTVSTRVYEYLAP